MLRKLFFIFFLFSYSTFFAQEVCNNGIDDDGDGLIDCYDPQCNGNSDCGSFFYGKPDVNCSVNPTNPAFTLNTLWQSTVTVSARSTVIVGDIDNDGVPEVVTHRSGPNELYVLDGVTGALKLTINCPAITDFADAIAIGDTDDDGFGEIYVVTNDNMLRCFEHDGTAKAGFTVTATGGTNESIPGIADFDQDGVPEIYKDNRIYNSLTGAQIVSGGAGSVGNNPGSNGAPASMPIAADVLPDSYCATCDGLELVCGNQVYAIDISGASIIAVANSLPTALKDGFTSVADIDLYGQLDVVVVSNGTIYVWDPRLGVQLGNTFSIDNTGAGGRANIADYDNDGLPEIGAGGRHRYVVVDIDTATNALSQKWIKTIVDGSEHTTGSVFDFDCDGKAQVVYRDENNLFIWDGETGNVISSVQCGSATRSELPTIVDVDGDGQVNIVCTCGGNGSGSGSVKAFNSSTNQWVGSRKVMNQHAYFITNINDDLSIPIQQQNNALIPQINGFSAQSPIYDVNWQSSCIPLANVDITIDSVIYCAKPDSIVVSLTMCNIGSKVSALPLTLSVYNASPNSGGTLVSTVQINDLIYPDSCLKDTITVPYNGSQLTYHIYINDDGTSPSNAPQLLFMECDSTNNKDSVLLSPPSLSLAVEGDTVICVGESTLITASGLTTYSWLPATGLSSTTGASVTANPSTTTTYTITGTNTTTGCTNNINCTIIVNPKPVAIFGSTSVCQGSATQFTDTSTTSLGTVNAWNYDFGDNNTLNLIQNPSHIYDSGGVYTVTLVVANTFGCVDTITKSVTVFYKPNATYTSSDVCFGDSVYFNNTSTIDPSDSIASALWSFDDNSPTSTLINPSHFYTSGGTYNVTLITTSANNCTDIAVVPVSVFEAPTTLFSYNNACFGDATNFTNQSVPPTVGTITSWEWTFGDGSTNNTVDWSPSHIYTAFGDFEVRLITFSSNLGCSDTLLDTITVYPKPLANWSTSEVCLGTGSVFSDSSTVINSTISDWLWNFGDNSATDNNQNTTHNYLNFGSFETSLIVNTIDGCSDTLVKNVLVHPVPTAQFETANVCADSVANFYNQSTLPTNSLNDVLTSWDWSFGNGTSYSGATGVSNQYTTYGVYSVKLVVASSFGCVDSATTNITINPNPVVEFTTNTTAGCEELCITFQSVSTIDSGAISSWLWNFGNGANGSLETATHCYSNSSDLPQTFSPTLTVVSDNSCTNTLTKNDYITVYPLPNVSFGVSPQLVEYTNPIITITNQSTVATLWNWSFGDGDTSSAEQPYTHIYQDTGSYTVTLIGTTEYNCADTSSELVVVEPDFLFFVPSAFTPNDDGVNDSFIGKGVFIVEFEMQIFDRWGNLVYETTDLTKPWDGKVKDGTDFAQQDVYVYSIHVVDVKNNKHKYKGIVTLIK